MRLEKAAMIRVLHEEPAFSEMFVSHLLARTIRVEEDLVDLGRVDRRTYKCRVVHATLEMLPAGL